MIQTIIMYTLSLIVCFILARDARIKNKKNFVCAVVMILTLMAGLRAESVGIDTPGYVERFKLILNNQIQYVWGIEYTYKVIMLVISKVFKNYTLFLCVMAFITNCLIVVRLWEFREITKFEFAITVYYIMFYFYGYNIIRQMVAVAIIFWATRFIEQKKYIWFILLTFVAFLFHTSALFGLAFLAVELLEWKHLSKKQRIFMITGLFGSPAVMGYLMLQMQAYSGYLVTVQGRIGTVLFAKIILFAFSVIGVKKHIIAVEKKELLDYKVKVIEIYYLIGLVLGFSGYIFPVVNRISLYFYLFECVYIGLLMKYKKWKSGYPLCYILMYGLIFISMFMGTGQGQVPYLFFWQQQ